MLAWPPSRDALVVKSQVRATDMSGEPGRERKTQSCPVEELNLVRERGGLEGENGGFRKNFKTAA